jgi:hypothetical protein
MAKVRTFSGACSVTAAALLMLPACSKRDAASDLPQDNSPDIVMQSDQGFHDLVFAVADYRHHADGSQSLLARGRYQGATVEMRIALDGDWRAQELGAPGLRGFKGQLQLERTGPASDALMRALDALYGTKLGAARFGKSTPFTAISLEGQPQALNTSPTKMKLFYEGGSGDNYAEVFLNVDLSKARVELREKSPNYRAKLVSVLSETP